MTYMRWKLGGLMIAALIAFGQSAGAEDDPIAAAGLVSISFNAGGHEDQYQAQEFTVIAKDGKTIQGKALSAAAQAEAEMPRYGKETCRYFHSRCFPTGAEKQAFEFPAAGAYAIPGSIVFTVKGRGWDINASPVEELITLEGPAGNVVFGKSAANTLALWSSSGSSAKFPIDFDPNRLHFFAIAYDGKTAQIYVDGQPKLPDGTVFTMPKEISRIIVGQTSAGSKTNKAMDDIATYNRVLLMPEVNRLAVEVSGIIFRKEMAVIKTRKPVKIDGEMAPGEWDDAAQIAGLLNLKWNLDVYNFGMSGPGEAAAHQSTFWVTYDDQYLYVAHYSPPPPSIRGQENLIVTMLKDTTTRHDDSLDRDDFIRISLAKPFPNGDEYRILINQNGTTYDFSTGGMASGSKLEGTTLGWDPNVVIGSRLTDKGWCIEVALPWKDFYFGKPADGEVLPMNFGRGWKQMFNEGHAWTCGTRTWQDDTLNIGQYVCAAMGEVRFQGEKGVIVRLQDVGNIRQGALDVRADLVNRTGESKTLNAEVTSNTGEVTNKQTFVVPPGASVPFKFSAKTVDPRTHEVQFRVTDAKSGGVYYVTTLPVLRKTRPEIYVRKLRSKEELRFETSLEFMGQYPLATAMVALRIAHKDTGKLVFKEKYNRLAHDQPVFTVSTKDWPVGKYDAEFTFTAKGMKPYKEIVVYNRLPLPPWWNCDAIGRDDGVPYPWTDLAVTNNAIDCWGRRYQFGDGLLPQQVLTAGISADPKPNPAMKILRSPIRVVIKTDTGATLDSAAVKADGAWTKTTATRVEGRRTVHGPGFDLRNDLWAEYDGLVWCRLTIDPKQKVTLSRMELEIPLSKEFTDVINAYDYSMRNTGKLKPEGFTSAIVPVWLGNGDGGIQWMCETDGQFFVNDNKKVVQVEVKPEGATLRVIMLDVPTGFEAPHSMEFGLAATPMRPRMYRAWNNPSWRLGWGSGPGGWYPKGEEFLPAPDYWPGVQKAHWSGGRANIYETTGACNLNFDNAIEFADEWLANPQDRVAPGIVGVTQASKNFRDYYVWRHRELFQRMPFQSVYYDCAHEIPSANPNAGAGYVRRDGSVVGVRPILGARDIVKRLYNIVGGHGPFLASLMHICAMPNMAYCGFCTESWDGENLGSALNETNPTYRYVVGPAEYRACFMGHNFGFPVLMLGRNIPAAWAERDGGVVNVVDYVFGLELLHDTLMRGALVDSPLDGAASLRTLRAIERHRLNSPAYEWIPYWRQNMVAFTNADMYATIYRFQPWAEISSHREMLHNLISRDWQFYSDKGIIKPPKKAVLIVFNNSAWEGAMRLKPNWKALGFETLENLEVENAVHRYGARLKKIKDKDGKEVEKAVFFDNPAEYARIENGELVFPMTKYNYRMIVLTQPQGLELEAGVLAPEME